MAISQEKSLAWFESICPKCNSIALASGFYQSKYGQLYYCFDCQNYHSKDNPKLPVISKYKLIKV